MSNEDSLKKYFTHDKERKEVVFTGDTCKVYIPKLYENYGLCEISNVTQTLGIFEVEINDTIRKGYVLPAIITMDPSDVSFVTLDDIPYNVLHFENGDIFITSTSYIKSSYILGVLFKEYIELGHIPKFIKYDKAATLFDTILQTTGVKLDLNPTTFEMILAFIHRTRDNLLQQYRYSNFTTNPVVIPLRNISFGPESTTAKIVGSYMEDGLNSAIVNQAEKHSDLEDFLRM